MNTVDFHRLFSYNEWAMDHQLTAIRRLTEEQLHRDLGGSFGTIHRTLLHLVGAEELWITRLLGQETPSGLPEPANFPTLEAVERLLGATRQKWKSYWEQLDDQQLQLPFSYRNLRGEEVTLALWQALHHVANHGTYHRGQLTSMLRMVGETPPAIDALVYYLAQQQR
ncbi:DinB family protein [Brevibacillus sp. H7]|jgi:uncharacterized damage-inducible protein DinB|uniref:DinB family protein n=1 Tax=Brevibacillus sp. H7 TaxID=3349138 RepID=UPI0038054D32